MGRKNSTSNKCYYRKKERKIQNGNLIIGNSKVEQMTYLKAIKGRVVVNFPLHTNQRKKDEKTKEMQKRERERERERKRGETESVGKTKEKRGRNKRSNSTLQPS